MGRFRSSDFLPTTLKEVRQRGWEQLDVILFSGDAYVDHPSFGVAVIGRILERAGYKVAIVAQPSWNDDLRDFKKLGVPRLFFGVTSGNMDSMVNHYTAAKRLRSNDAYTPGNVAGFRPDYAVSVYTKILKDLFPSTPVIIGGIEASLRRLTHYDYWQNRLLPSILIESNADLLVYGMGDKPVLEVAKALHNGFNTNLLRKIKQVAFVAPQEYAAKLDPQSTITLHSYQQCMESKMNYAENFKNFEIESNKMEAKTIVEQYDQRVVVVNPPYPYLTQQELDSSFDLPYTREPHPKYEKRGDIPAYEMIKYSVNLHRGCFGGCSFCTISAHQGKFVSSRSWESIKREINEICSDPNFKGNLSDIGGPSANMYAMGGRNKEVCKLCKKPSCLFPEVCKNLDNNHSNLLKLYAKIRALPAIKKAYIGSGIRYDLIDEKSRMEYLSTVIKHHTSGRLKVAPEHTEERVLKLMRKPSFELFRKLNGDFSTICKKSGLNYQLIPYFISSHPECAMKDMQNLSVAIRGLNFNLEQVQDFTPTPMTLSTAIFYCGMDPYTQKKVYVARDKKEKQQQKDLFFFKKDK